MSYRAWVIPSRYPAMIGFCFRDLGRPRSEAWSTGKVARSPARIADAARLTCRLCGVWRIALMFFTSLSRAEFADCFFKLCGRLGSLLAGFLADFPVVPRGTCVHRG